MPDLMIDQRHVVHETIDGETILIHLGTGTYYSLDGVADEVWQLVVHGAPGGELAARVARHYEIDPAVVERSVNRFVDELVHEGLLTPAEPGLAPGHNSEAGGGERPAAGQFVEPVLRKYTDMQEFMLVDPLHDVEPDAGWPHVKAG